MPFFFFSSRRRHTRWPRDWSSDVCSSDLLAADSDVVLLSLPTPAVVTGVVGELVEAGASGLRVLDTSTIDPGTAAQAAQTLQRSEERRVGKEWGSRRAPYRTAGQGGR